MSIRSIVLYCINPGHVARARKSLLKKQFPPNAVYASINPPVLFRMLMSIVFAVWLDHSLAFTRMTITQTNSNHK